MSLEISADFDGGNIEVLSVAGDTAELAIRQDANGPWFQWFYFKVAGASGRRLTLRIVNAGASAYPDGWPGYRACVSHDGETWVRTATRYAAGVLEISGTPLADACLFAYFAPYGQARHRALIARAGAAPGVSVRSLGTSVDGRPIDCVSVGDGAVPIWLVGRQHAGETMASWWMEGALERLLDRTDPVAARLRAGARLHLVPIVNIDGAVRGHLRGNAAGLDLNRQWRSPDPHKAPEIAAILKAMDETGVALSLDVHGDETLPHVFVDGCDSDPAATPAQIEGVAAFKAALLEASPAFQTKVGYPPTYGGEAGAGMCNRAVARRYGAVGLTLEMPFKDALEAPNPVAGWSAQASKAMGRDCLEALASMLERLTPG